MEKKFIGNGKTHTFADGGKVINGYLNLSKMSSEAPEFGFQNKDGDTMIKFKLHGTKNKPGECYLVVDTWKPEPKQEQSNF